MKNGRPGMEVVRKIVTGDFHPLLEGALLDRLADRASRTPLRLTPIIVPTNLLGLRLSRALAERTGGHADLRFMTLVDFAAWAAPSPLPGGRALLPRRADDVVVRRLLDDGIAAGGYFEAIADRPGLATAILAAIRDLKEASYAPDSFEAALTAAGLPAGGRRSKCAELARIWRAYEQALAEGGWADRLDLMREAAASIETRGERLPPTTVYGFYDLNPLQKRLISACAESADTVVFFPFVEAAAFDYARPTLDWFLALGFEREDLGGDGRLVPLPGEIRILSAPGEAREAREGVRALAGLVEERGLSLQDAAIVTRSPQVYSDLFAEELLRLDAPSYAESPPPLSRTRSGRSLIKLALAVQSGFARSDLVEFLGLASLRRVGPSAEPPVSEWNKATMLAGITSGADKWLPALRAIRARIERASPGDRFAESHAGLAPAIASLDEVVRGLLEDLSDLPARATVGEFLERLLRTFAWATSEGEERGRVIAEARGLLALSDVAGPVTFPYFVELLRSQLDSAAPRAERFGVGGPTVLSVMSARGLRYPLVIVPGLVEKEFPLRRRQDPILLDGERARLNATLDDDPLRRLPLRATGGDEERLLFRLAVETAADTLVLSYPRLDPSNARPRVASSFLLRALEELTGERQDYEALDASDRVTRIPLSRRFPERRAEALTREEFDGCSILAAAGGDVSEIAYLLHEEGPLPRRLAMEEARWGVAGFTEYDGALTSKAALDAVEQLSGFTRDGRPGKTVSATALEEYATCPFRFLMHRVLGIEPIEEPEEALELSALDRGSLYHAVLEEFMRKLADRGEFTLRPETRDLLLAVAERLIDRGPWDLAGYPGARALVLRELVFDLALWLADETAEARELVPSHFEVRFGGDRSDGDDALSTEEGVPFDAVGDVAIVFGGRIDRIDVSPRGDRARVIDYKSGRRVPSAGAVIEHGKRLQLPVYLLAARRMLAGPHPGIDVESAEYLYVAARGARRSLELPSGLLDDKMDDLRAAVGLIVQGIAAGMFFVFPEDATCRNCEFAEACTSGAVPLTVMKKGDRRASFFMNGLAGIK
jgi:ATP-dependent helicase/nuclease subunit B